MADKRWKVQERETARILGGQRVGPTGKAAADVISPVFGIEVKTRKSLPGWLTEALAQARRNCPDGKTPLLVIAWCPGQGRRVRRYAVLDLDAFKEVLHEA